jgi:hypothetical protein
MTNGYFNSTNALSFPHRTDTHVYSVGLLYAFFNTRGTIMAKGQQRKNKEVKKPKKKPTPVI